MELINRLLGVALFAGFILAGLFLLTLFLTGLGNYYYGGICERYGREHNLRVNYYINSCEVYDAEGNVVDILWDNELAEL